MHLFVGVLMSNLVLISTTSYNEVNKTSTTTASNFRSIAKHLATDDFMILIEHHKNNPGIYFSDIDPQDAVNLNFVQLKTDPRPQKPYSIAFDSVTSNMYWSDLIIEAIFRTSLSDGRTETFISFEVGDVNDMFIDENDRKLYWTDPINKRIERINLDGTERTHVISVMPDGAYSITIDTENRYLYWCSVSPYQIERAQIDNVNATRKVIIDDTVFPDGITLSIRTGKMYWCDGVSGEGKVYEANLDGSDRRLVGTSTFPNDIVLYDDYLYWSDSTEGSLYYVEIADGPEYKQYIRIPFKEPKLVIHRRVHEDCSEGCTGLAVGTTLLGFFFGIITVSFVFVLLGKMHNSGKNVPPVKKVNSLRESRKIRVAASTRDKQRTVPANVTTQQPRLAAPLPDPDSPKDDTYYTSIENPGVRDTEASNTEARDTEYINAKIGSQLPTENQQL